MDKDTTYDEKEKYNKTIWRYLNMSEGGYGFGGGFALIVVLFILLIIVGASWFIKKLKT